MPVPILPSLASFFDAVITWVSIGLAKYRHTPVLSSIDTAASARRRADEMIDSAVSISTAS